MTDNPHEDSLTKDTLATIQRFNEAFNRHDVDGVMAAMTEDVCSKIQTHRPMASAITVKSPFAASGSVSLILHPMLLLKPKICSQVETVVSFAGSIDGLSRMGSRDTFAGSMFFGCEMAKCRETGVRQGLGDAHLPQT